MCTNLAEKQLLNVCQGKEYVYNVLVIILFDRGRCCFLAIDRTIDFTTTYMSHVVVVSGV